MMELSRDLCTTEKALDGDRICSDEAGNKSVVEMEKNLVVEDVTPVEAVWQTDLVKNIPSDEAVAVNETPLVEDKLKIEENQISEHDLQEEVQFSEHTCSSTELKVNKSEDLLSPDSAQTEGKTLVEDKELSTETKTLIDDSMSSIENELSREETEIEIESHQDEKAGTESHRDEKTDSGELAHISGELQPEKNAENVEVRESETFQDKKESTNAVESSHVSEDLQPDIKETPFHSEEKTYIKEDSAVNDNLNSDEVKNDKDAIMVESENKPGFEQIQVEEGDQIVEKIQSHVKVEIDQHSQDGAEFKLQESSQVIEKAQIRENNEPVLEDSVKLGDNLLVADDINPIESITKEVIEESSMLESVITDVSHDHPQSRERVESINVENEVNEASQGKEETNSDEDEFLDVGDGEGVDIQNEEPEYSEEEEEVGEDEEYVEEEEEEEEESEAELESEQDTKSEQEEISDDNDYSHRKEDGILPEDGDGVSYVNEKRIMGDGEEEPEVKAEKRLDDDEDKANPAYIPRKGAFYEHDQRLDPDDETDQQEDQKLASRPNKKLWVDENKWQHDRYDARLQAPKSSQELADTYGYDIRRGRESDIPVRNVRSRGRRPGQNNRFGDYLPRRTEPERSGGEERFYTANKPVPDRSRNQINNENRLQRGRLDHHDQNVLNERSEFPPLRGENVDALMSVNVGQPVSQNRVNPVETARPPVEPNVNRRGQENTGNNQGPLSKTEQRPRREFKNEDDGERRQFERSRGELLQGRQSSRGRGRGRGRRQQDLHEPGAMFVNNDEFYERNNASERNSQNYSRSNRQSDDQRNHGRIDNRRELEMNSTRGSLAEDSFRRNNIDNTKNRVLTTESRRSGELEHEPNHYKHQQYSELDTRSQGKSFRVQQPSQGNDYSDRRNNRQNPEAFATRTIQNSNISGRLAPSSRTREMEKQELLSSVSTAMKNMALDERGMASKTLGSNNVRSDRLADHSDHHRGSSTFKAPVQDKVYRDVQGDKTALEDKKDGDHGRKKTSVVIQTTNTPEMIPPVTIASAYSKPPDRGAVAPRLAASERSQNKGWAGGEFTPAWRLQTTSSGNVENANVASSGKPKRYSTQRQKAAGAEGAYVETPNAEYQGTVEMDEQTMIQQHLTGSLPSRPLPAATYYDSSASYTAASFHPAQGMSLGMHGMPYQMPANLQHNLYNAQPQIAKSGNPIHNVFLPPPGSMLPNPYLSMPSLMNYPSQFQMAPVQLQPGRPNEHLRGSLQDQEQVDMHRMVYFNQQGITLPLMHPQFIDQSSYVDETSAVDPSMAAQGYMEARDMTSPTHAQQEY